MLGMFYIHLQYTAQSESGLSLQCNFSGDKTWQQKSVLCDHIVEIRKFMYSDFNLGLQAG
jgi:hypothetical protein